MNLTDSMLSESSQTKKKITVSFYLQKVLEQGGKTTLKEITVVASGITGKGMRYLTMVMELYP